MSAPLSRTIISSLQTVRYNNRALSMAPFGLHVAGPSGPACLPLVGCMDCGNSVKYINMSNLFIAMQDDENGNKGEHYALDTKIWKLLDIKKKTDARGRIYVNETNYEREIRVFVSDVDTDPETCKHYSLLPHSIFSEIRKSRVKEQAGEPMKVQSSGDVWLGAGNKNKFVKVFVKVE